MKDLRKVVNYVRHPVKIVGYLNYYKVGRVIPDKIVLKCLYRDSMGKSLDLKKPLTYNEKLQWLKLYDRKSEYTIMVDKYGAKKYVADRIGDQYVIPLLGVWDSFDEIDFDNYRKSLF